MTDAEVQKMIADAIAAANVALTKQLNDTQTQLADVIAKAKKKPVDDSSIDGIAEPDADDATKALWRPHVAKVVADAVAKAVAKANEEHAADIAKREQLAKTDESIVVDGKSIFKSAVGEASFTLLKSLHDTNQINEFSKRADSEIGNLPGTTIVKAKALRAVSALAKEDREAIEAMLKGGDAAMKSSMATLGHNHQSETSAAGQLNKMVDDLAKAKNISKAVAYDEVLKTPEGSRLYGAERNERSAA